MDESNNSANWDEKIEQKMWWPLCVPESLVSHTCTFVNLHDHISLQQCDRRLRKMALLPASSPRVLDVNMMDIKTWRGLARCYPQHLTLSFFGGYKSRYATQLTNLPLAIRLQSLILQTASSIDTLRAGDVGLSLAGFPRLTTFIHTTWPTSRNHIPLDHATLQFASALTHLELQMTTGEVLARLPLSLRTLVIVVMPLKWDTDVDKELWYDKLSRMGALERLELGDTPLLRPYSLSDLARNSPRLVTLVVQPCLRTTQPLSFSHLTSVGYRHETNAYSTLDERPSDPYRHLLQIPTLTKLTLLEDANDLRDSVHDDLSCRLLLLLLSSVGSVALRNLEVPRIRHYELSIYLCQPPLLQLHTLSFECDDAFEFACLTHLHTLEVLYINSCMNIDRLMTALLDNLAHASPETVAQTISRVWPPFKKLHRLVLRNALTERNLHALIRCYHKVDMTASYALRVSPRGIVAENLPLLSTFILPGTTMCTRLHCNTLHSVA
jgi:hypothetical protein